MFLHKYIVASRKGCGGKKRLFSQVALRSCSLSSCKRKVEDVARRVKTTNFIDRTVLFRTEPHDPRESLLSNESIFCFPLK